MEKVDRLAYSPVDVYVYGLAPVVDEFTHARVSRKTCTGKACRSISLAGGVRSVQSHLSRFYFILSAFYAYAIRKYFFPAVTHVELQVHVLQRPDVRRFSH